MDMLAPLHQEDNTDLQNVSTVSLFGPLVPCGFVDPLSQMNATMTHALIILAIYTNTSMSSPNWRRTVLVISLNTTKLHCKLKGGKECHCLKSHPSMRAYVHTHPHDCFSISLCWQGSPCCPSNVLHETISTHCLI